MASYKLSQMVPAGNALGVLSSPLRLAPQGHFLRGVYVTFYDAIYAL